MATRGPLAMFASLTGTRSTLRMLKASGWGVLVTPDTLARCRVPTNMHKALDNGAWGAFAGKRAWDAALFTWMLERHGRDALWVVVPDVVADAEASTARTREWLAFCQDRCPRVLVAVQDGMTRPPVPLGPRVGVFVGGSTEWKLATLGRWAALARRAGAWCHVGRVNSVKRINLCIEAGATSADGNNSVLFPVNHERLARAARNGVPYQQELF